MKLGAREEARKKGNAVRWPITFFQYRKRWRDLSVVAWQYSRSGYEYWVFARIVLKNLGTLRDIKKL